MAIAPSTGTTGHHGKGPLVRGTEILKNQRNWADSETGGPWLLQDGTTRDASQEPERVNPGCLVGRHLCVHLGAFETWELVVFTSESPGSGP